MITAEEIYNKVVELKNSYYATYDEWEMHGAEAWPTDDLEKLDEMIDNLDKVTDALKNVVAYEKETEEND